MVNKTRSKYIKKHDWNLREEQRLYEKKLSKSVISSSIDDISQLVIKTEFDDDKIKCPNCGNFDECSGEEGYYCNNCHCTFNSCFWCNDEILLHLIGWGKGCGPGFKYNKNGKYVFNYNHTNKLNPKFFATINDPEISDDTGYKWYCPKCHKIDYSHPD